MTQSQQSMVLGARGAIAEVYGPTLSDPMVRLQVDGSYEMGGQACMEMDPEAARELGEMLLRAAGHE